jgi:hypothetical protein
VCGSTADTCSAACHTRLRTLCIQCWPMSTRSLQCCSNNHPSSRCCRLMSPRPWQALQHLQSKSRPATDWLKRRTPSCSVHSNTWYTTNGTLAPRCCTNSTLTATAGNVAGRQAQSHRGSGGSDLPSARQTASHSNHSCCTTSITDDPPGPDTSGWRQAEARFSNHHYRCYRCCC